MHDPVIGLDEDLNVVFANGASIKIIGESDAEIIGHSVITLAAKNDLIRILIQDLKPVPHAAKNGKPKPLKIFADGKESYFEKEILHISVIPTGELGLILTGHFILLRNITYLQLHLALRIVISTYSHY